MTNGSRCCSGDDTHRLLAHMPGAMTNLLFFFGSDFGMLVDMEMQRDHCLIDAYDFCAGW